MANPTSKYEDPEKIPLEDLRAAVKELQDMRLAYSSAGKWDEFPKDIAAQLKRAEIVLARREGEPHGALRTIATTATAIPRGIASIAGLPGDVYQIAKTGLGMFPEISAAVDVVEPFIGEAPPTSQDIQQGITNAPTLFGGRPLLTPETSGQKFLDQLTQGFTSALTPVGLAAKGTRIPIVTPSPTTLAKQGIAKTAVKEGAAGAAAGLMSEGVQQATEGMPESYRDWAIIPQLVAGITSGAIAGAGGGEAFDILQRMRNDPGWTLGKERWMHRLGMQFQRLINGGTPQEIAMREVARAIREQGGEIYEDYKRAAYLKGLAPTDPTATEPARYIDRPAPPEAEWTLGQGLNVPFLQHLESSANPELAPHIVELRKRQAAGQEAVIGQMHEEGGIPRPEGPVTLTEAAQAGNVTVPTEKIAQEAFPRYTEESLTLQRGTETELAGLGAEEAAARAQRQAQEQALKAQKPQAREAIIEEEIRLKDEREGAATQAIREEEARSSRVLEMQRMRLKTEAEEHLKAAEDIALTQVEKLEGPRATDVSFRGGYDLRQNLVQQHENFRAEADIRYGKIRQEAAGLKAPNPTFMTDIQTMRDNAVIAQRADPNFPSEAVDQFYDAIIKRKSLEEEALAQATPGYKPKTPREIAATITDADLEVGDYTQLRSNLLQWQRYNGATFYSKELTKMADEGMEKLVTDRGRPELAQKVRETNAWYRIENTPFSTGPGEELLRLHHTAIPTEITYFDPLTKQNITKTIQFQVPIADTVAKVLDNPSRQRLQSLIQATGGARQTRAAIEEMLAHRLYSQYGGDVGALTPNQLADFHRKNREMFALLDEFGMGETGKKFADIQSARRRMAEVEAQNSAEVQRERLKSLEDYEKQELNRVTEQANRAKAVQQYADKKSIRAMKDAEKMTEAQSLQQIEADEAQRLAQIGEQRTALIDGRKKHEQTILARYLVPDTITPENPIGDVAAHMSKMLETPNQKEFLANVMRLMNSVRGDSAAELAVGHSIAAELWRRSNGDAKTFKHQISQNRRALQAAGANQRGIRILEEQGEILEILQRQFTDDAMKGMTEREKLLFKGRTTQQRAAAVFNFLGGILGANLGARWMYDPGAAKAVSISGTGAMGGRAAGGPIAKFLGTLAMRPSADAFNANTAQAVVDIVFKPDWQKPVLDYMNNPTPKNKARLRSFYLSIGLSDREGYYGPTSPEGVVEAPAPAPAPAASAPAAPQMPAGLETVPPGSAPEPFSEELMPPLP